MPVTDARHFGVDEALVELRVDQTAKTVTLDAPRTLSLPPDATLPASKLGGFSKGDRVRFTLSPDGKTIASIDKASVNVAFWPRIAAMAAALALVLGLALLVSRGALYAFILGADNRYSNSKTQLALWSTTVFTAYLATVILRVWVTGDWSGYLGGVEIPGDLAALSGLSALTYAGAKAVTTQKADTAKARAVADRQAGRPVMGPEKSRADVPNLLTDLFQNDLGQVDIGDFQMILISLVAAVIYILSVFAFLGRIELSPHVTLPDVDTTLLAGFGVGQGAYLMKKAASNPGEG